MSLCQVKREFLKKTTDGLDNLMVFSLSVKDNTYEPFAKIIETMVTAFIGEIVTECPLASQIMGDERTVFIREPAYK
jgi:hypothetical protein